MERNQFKYVKRSGCISPYKGSGRSLCLCVSVYVCVCCEWVSLCRHYCHRRSGCADTAAISVFHASPRVAALSRHASLDTAWHSTLLSAAEMTLFYSRGPTEATQIAWQPNVSLFTFQRIWDSSTRNAGHTVNKSEWQRMLGVDESKASTLLGVCFYTLGLFLSPLTTKSPCFEMRVCATLAGRIRMPPILWLINMLCVQTTAHQSNNKLELPLGNGSAWELAVDVLCTNLCFFPRCFWRGSLKY